MSELDKQPNILFQVKGRTGIIILNRPRAFNALSLEMFSALHARLKQWADDGKIAQVMIEAVPGKAFCAGGDVREIYDWGRAGDVRARRIFATEYPLNIAIKSYNKPYIAVIDGLAMGGGVGVSLNGNVRIATENFTFAMPETGIGLFPDVGGSYFLPRCPGEVGMYLGLTGARLKAADALYAGLIDLYVPHGKLDDLTATLIDSDNPMRDAARFSADPGTPQLPDLQDRIDRLFSATSVEEIIARLAGDGSDWAKEILGILAKKSPTSLKITYRQLRNGRGLSFEDCMAMEYRMVSRVLKAHDFFEGVRAAVIDKDQTPKWQPRALSLVDDDMVRAYFEPLEDELDLQV